MWGCKKWFDESNATVSESGRILTGLPDSVASVSEPGASSDFSMKRI
jgi:hypothetical protein